MSKRVWASVPRDLCWGGPLWWCAGGFIAEGNLPRVEQGLCVDYARLMDAARASYGNVKRRGAPEPWSSDHPKQLSMGLDRLSLSWLLRELPADERWEL